MIMTDHAKERWRQRFANKEPHYEFNRAVKPNKRQLSDIKKQCPQHKWLIDYRRLYKVRYLLTPTNIVFVCGEGDRVITVFPYKNRRNNTMNDEFNKAYRKGKKVHIKNLKHKW